MNVVIVGCGRVGAQLAALLAIEGHAIVVVDREARAFERLPKSFQGERLVGIGFDRDILRRAGIARADAVVAVTNGDNTNIVVALIAHREFHVPKIVTRVADPERADIYRRFGIATISATTWAANEIKMMLQHADLTPRLSLGSGDSAIIELELPPTLAGHVVDELTVPGEIMVTAIVRHGHGLIPFPGARFQHGDIVYLAVLSTAMNKLKQLVGWE